MAEAGGFAVSHNAPERFQCRRVQALSRCGPLSDRWDLTRLLDRPVENFNTLIKELDHLVSRLENWRPRLTPDISATAFLDLLRTTEEIATKSARLGAYAYLRFTEDTRNLQARSFKSNVEERLTSFQNRTLFFELWWQSLDTANAERLRSSSGDLAYHLDTVRRFKSHTLSESEEKIVNLKNITGRHAINTLYDVLTNGMTFTLKVEGKRRTLTREQLSSYVRNPSPSLREESYKELLRVFEANHNVLGEMYSALVHDWRGENLGLRRFTSPIANRNLGNDVPDIAVDSLLKVCETNAGIFQEYWRLKGRLCRIRPMTRYHIYAPYQLGCKRYRFADAVRMVLQAYRSFSPHLADLAEQVFADRHIDARSRPGKASGAYCYSVAPGLTPYVLLNYTGEARDVATLAHELGHAAHAMIAAGHSVFTFHATLPLAETASVFGERILSDSLMLQDNDKKVNQALLLAQIEDIYATVIRQAYFVIFEKQAHEILGKGGTLDDLAHAYLGNLRQQFGRAVRVPDEFKWEWLTIPHIFASPFYCYAYSFGNLLVLSLYHRYRLEGSAFVPRYLALLAAGGSKSPADILAEIGLDVCSEALWESGFAAIRGMLVELEKTLS